MRWCFSADHRLLNSFTPRHCQHLSTCYQFLKLTGVAIPGVPARLRHGHLPEACSDTVSPCSAVSSLGAVASIPSAVEGAHPGAHLSRASRGHILLSWWGVALDYGQLFYLCITMCLSNVRRDGASNDQPVFLFLGPPGAGRAPRPRGCTDASCFTSPPASCCGPKSRPASTLPGSRGGDGPGDALVSDALVLAIVRHRLGRPTPEGWLLMAFPPQRRRRPPPPRRPPPGPRRRSPPLCARRTPATIESGFCCSS